MVLTIKKGFIRGSLEKGSVNQFSIWIRSIRMGQNSGTYIDILHSVSLQFERLVVSLFLEVGYQKRVKLVIRTKAHAIER